MDTRKFFKFINAIYNGYHRNINAICSGKLDIEDWGRVLAYKRKGFETCAFVCYVQSPLFRDKVGIYYNRLKESLANYEKSNWFDYDFDINKNRRTYFEQKYHIIRKREITLACEFLEKLLNEPKPIFVNDKESDELSHYNLDYNEVQFKSIYTFLVDGKYLESTTTSSTTSIDSSGNFSLSFLSIKAINSSTEVAFIKLFLNSSSISIVDNLDNTSK